MKRHNIELTTPRARCRMLRVMPLVLAALLLSPAASPAPAGQESRRVVAIADIHGALDSFTAILQEVGLVDDELHWSGGDTIFVQTGDIADRGPDVRAAMDLLMRLQEEAPGQGGEVIVVLGNHEAMNLASYFRDTSAADAAAFVDEDSEKRQDEAYDQWKKLREKRAKALGKRRPRFDRDAWEEEHPLGYVERMDALGPDGVYGRWLRRLPTAVRIDNMLFMHAGLNPLYGDLDTDAINERISGELQKFDAAKQTMVDAGLITPYADLVDMIGGADDQLVAMLRRLEETGERPDLEGQELARTLEWVLDYADWQLLTRDGLLWFRGLAQWPEEEHAKEIAELLDKQGVDHIIVGHSVQLDGEIRTRFDGGVFLTDTGMLTAVYHGRPSALEIKDGTFTAYYVGERKTLLAEEILLPAAKSEVRSRFVPVVWRPSQSRGAAHLAPPQRVWMGPDGEPLPFATDDHLLEFLRTAEIVSIEELDKGKTKPRRIELEKNGVRARAIFHTVDIYREQARVGDRFHAVFRDSWRAQVAAYWVARLLGLDNVAPTVERTVDGEAGSLQLWLENDGLRSNADRVRARDYPLDLESWLAQEWSMNVFDALIFNDDRHTDNVLVDGEWKLWMIDHTRAFQRDPSIRQPEKLNRIDRRLMEELRQLDEQRLEGAVGEYLEREQINAIMARRDAILEHFSELIRTLGAANVLYGVPGPSARTTQRVA